MKTLTFSVIVASSVDCERAFSVAGLIHTDRRARLDPATYRKLMIVGNWVRNGMLDKEAFVSSFQDKDKGKDRQVAASVSEVPDVVASSSNGNAVASGSGSSSSAKK